MRVTVDSNGNMVGYDDYYPFGEQIPGRSGNEGNPDDRYKFTSKELDNGTGLMYFGARYYDPSIGRWLSVDPLGDNFANVSPYSYPYNNPLKYTDPTGMAGDDSNEDDEEKSWWDKIVDFVKSVFDDLPKPPDPNQPPPTHVDVKKTADKAAEDVAGKEKQEVVSTIIQNTEGNKTSPKPDMKRLIIEGHAKQRMNERNISEKTVNEAVNKGTAKPGNKPNTTVYDLPSNKSSTGRGIRVVTNSKTGKVITVIDKGTKFK